MIIRRRRKRRLTILPRPFDVRRWYEDQRAASGSTDPLHDPLYYWPGERSWQWWQWVSPEPRDDERTQYEQLRDLGLLSDDEREAIRQRAVEADRLLHVNPWSNGGFFRRPAEWWDMLSPQARDDGLNELDQLIHLEPSVLTSIEREILAKPRKALQDGEIRNRLSAYRVREQQLLGLPKVLTPYWKRKTTHDHNRNSD